MKEDATFCPVPALVPAGVVTLNRATILIALVVAFFAHVPLITTALFAVIAFAAIFGRRASLIYWIGTTLLRIPQGGDDGEDPRLMRFNNAIAAVLLGLAQCAFLFSAPIPAWILSGMVALAATLALCGFCVGCVLFYRFQLHKAQIAGRSK